MALPIAPTPVLEGKEAEKFLRTIFDETRYGTLPLVGKEMLFAKVFLEYLKNAEKDSKKLEIPKDIFEIE